METTATTLPPDMKYFPYNETEYMELKTIAATFRDTLPTDKLNWAWNNYKKITGSTEGQPCGCGSAAAHWKKAVDAINEFIRNKESQNA